MQGQLGEPFSKKDNEEVEDKSNQISQEPESSDSEHWERRQEKGSYPWTEVPSAVVTLPAHRLAQVHVEWEGMEGPSPEVFRSCSIAKLRAKAREHEAEIHSTVAKSGGERKTHTRDTDDRESD